MNLHDCVSKDSSRTELLLLCTEGAYEAARIDRDRMTQAIMPISSSFVLQEGLIEVLDNDVCQSLIAAIGVGIVLRGTDEFAEKLFDVAKLRYGKVIVVNQQAEPGRGASREVLRFFFRHMRPLIDGERLLALETPLEAKFTQNEFVERVLNPGTRTLKIVGSEDDFKSLVDTRI